MEFSVTTATNHMSIDAWFVASAPRAVHPGGDVARSEGRTGRMGWTTVQDTTERRDRTP